MNNENLETALADLCDAIRAVTLGSIESAVIEAAARELITNWNDHHADDPIDEAAELANWNGAVSRPIRPAGSKPQKVPRPPLSDSIPGQLYAPNGRRVIASKDWIPGNALIQNATRNADGSLEIEWEGETQVCWDGQYTETVSDRRIFLDDQANEWREDQLYLAT